MRQKTATFVLYTPFGTSKPNRALNIEYRRECLWSFCGQDEGELIEKATKYAKTLGFTATKIRYIVGGA